MAATAEEEDEEEEDEEDEEELECSVLSTMTSTILRTTRMRCWWW